MIRNLTRTGIALTAAIIAVSLKAGCDPHPAETTGTTIVPRPPVISPDYRDTVIPPNITPLNFTIRETASAYNVRISSTFGRHIEISSSDNDIRIPARPWQKLLSANKGKSLFFSVNCKMENGSWQSFNTITNTIAYEPIDSHVVYRLIPPINHSWYKIEICQRSVEEFAEKRLIDNRTFERGCVNCHTFMQNSPDTMSVQIRSSRFGLPMLVVKDNKIRNIDTRTGKGISPAAYHSWHPGGRVIAFSRNKPRPFEHTGDNVRDVWDDDSDLAVCFVEKDRVETPPAISSPDWRETWPSWSANGRFLYFCRSPQVTADRFEESRYDLMRIAYDPDSNTWGELETLVSGAGTGLSTAQPRESPNERWLLFSMFKYGSFPIYQPSSDLYVMDLQNRKYRRLEINSDLCDSWHCWSSNSHWIAFASKRDNGLMARIYFSFVDDTGRFHKPFILPQYDPSFYDSCVRTYNIPELITGPVPQSPARFGAAICEPAKVFTCQP